MFIVLLNYVKPLEQVEHLFQDHVAFLDKYYSEQKFIFSGRKIPRTGGVILVNSDSADEVKNIIAEDPFHVHGVAEYNIVEFTPTKYDPRFASFVR